MSCLSQNCFLLLDDPSLSSHLCPKSKTSFNAEAKVTSFLWLSLTSVRQACHVMVTWERMFLSLLRQRAAWGWGLCLFYLFIPGLACGRHITDADWTEVRMEWKSSVKVNASNWKQSGRNGVGSQRGLGITCNLSTRRNHSCMYLLHNWKLLLKNRGSHKHANIRHSR